MAGCLNMYVYTVFTPNDFWSVPRQPSGLYLDHLDERQGLVALCGRREWFTGQRRRKTNSS